MSSFPAGFYKSRIKNIFYWLTYDTYVYWGTQAGGAIREIVILKPLAHFSKVSQVHSSYIQFTDPGANLAARMDTIYAQIFFK